MHRIPSTLAVLMLLSVAVPAVAHEGMHMHGGKVSTVTGELVDTGCYLDSGERGAGHVSCATRCINNGMPMGLLTSNGTLYLLTLDHDNPDPYNSLKTMAGKTVSVTGAMLARSGMKAIDVSAVHAAGK